MNKLKFVALSFILIILFSSCDSEYIFSVEDAVTTEYINLSGYSQIEVENAISLTIHEGNPGSIVVEALQSIINRLDAYVYVTDSVLYIHRPHGFSFGISQDINISIPANNLKRIKMSGASEVNILKNHKVFNNSNVTLALSGASSFEGDIDVKTIAALSLELSGSSSFEGYIDVKTLDAHLSGASDIEIIGGSVETLKIDIEGSSDFDGRRFTTAILSATLSGASDAYISVASEITKADLSGASDLYYSGIGVILSNITASSASNLNYVDSF